MYPVVRSTSVPIAVRVVLADDQIALPVAGDGAVISLGGALCDVDHVRDPVAALAGLAARATQRPPGPQALGQIAAQRAAGLDVQRLVDRLVRHPHLRIFRELWRRNRPTICSGE